MLRILILAALGIGGPLGATAATQVRPDVAQLERELALERARNAELEERIEVLLVELDAARSARMSRELQWLEFNRFLQSLELAPRPDKELEFAVHVPWVDEGVLPELPEDHEAREAARRRGDEIRSSMRTLLRMEQVLGLDLLEAGSVQPGGTGPVIFRQLDDRGRLSGSLSAQRLRLESSRAAHTITLVLEDGFESRGGVRTPFSEGTRRITLPHVDPTPWLEVLPELFPAEEVRSMESARRRDYDGLRADLNALLATDASSGFYQIRHLGDAGPDGIREVHMLAFDASGRLVRRLFADRMEIRIQSKGVQLVLKDGAIVRGDQKTAFRDGRFRIFLPRADGDAWSALKHVLESDVAGSTAESAPPGE